MFPRRPDREVYDAELHAVHEALISLSKINTLSGKTYIYIDNSAAIFSLEQNIHNCEPERQAILTAHNLCQIGWDKITGNEAANYWKITSGKKFAYLRRGRVALGALGAFLRSNHGYGDGPN
jgi:hypothetical protein